MGKGMGEVTDKFVIWSRESVFCPGQRLSLDDQRPTFSAKASTHSLSFFCVFKSHFPSSNPLHHNLNLTEVNGRQRGTLYKKPNFSG